MLQEAQKARESQLLHEAQSAKDLRTQQEAELQNLKDAAAAKADRERQEAEIEAKASIEKRQRLTSKSKASSKPNSAASAGLKAAKVKGEPPASLRGSAGTKKGLATKGSNNSSPKAMASPKEGKDIKENDDKAAKDETELLAVHEASNKAKLIQDANAAKEARMRAEAEAELLQEADKLNVCFASELATSAVDRVHTSRRFKFPTICICFLFFVSLCLAGQTRAGRGRG